MDIIMDNGGDFDILEFDIGKRKSDISTAKIMVSADSPSLLDRILDELSLLGVSIAEVEGQRAAQSLLRGGMDAADPARHADEAERASQRLFRGGARRDSSHRNVLSRRS